MKKIFFILTLFAASCLMAMPKAVVFDFGGVMMEEANSGEFIQKSLQINQEEYLLASQEKRKAQAKGKTTAEFWTSYAQSKGITLPADWGPKLESIILNFKVDPNMYHLVDELKEKKIQVAMLSNNDKAFVKPIQDLGLYKPFEPCLLSCDIGVEKPDTKAFEILIEKLGKPANEIVFIDDKVSNIEAAKKVGIDAILFTSEDQLRAELQKRGAL